MPWPRSLSPRRPVPPGIRGIRVVTPANWPRQDPLAERLLIIDPGAGVFRDARTGELPAWLRPGDLLVVNDAATLPASFSAIDRSGRPIEIRLAGELAGSRWSAVLFGEGDWRTPTERRPEPPSMNVG